MFIQISFSQKVFAFFLFLRLLSVWFIQTSYAPDEYWQSLEVAHRLSFGYGYLTWEWQKGIRNYLYPLMISSIYTLLKWLGLDSRNAVVYVPRLIQAILSAYSDFTFFKWCGQKKWAVFCSAVEWFWFFTASRTLINSLETSLTVIALSKFPWKGSKYEKSPTTFLCIVAIVCAIRPTAVIHWLIPCLYHLYLNKYNWHNVILQKYIPIGLIVLSITTIIDSVCNGSLLITPLEFFKFNIIHGIANEYGVHPWHWYLVAGIPTVYGIYMFCFLGASINIIKNRQAKEDQFVLLLSVVFSVFIYSCLAHKEFRFILPLMPMFMYITVQYISNWSKTAVRWRLWLMFTTLLVSNLAPAYYLGLVHQRGVLDVMPVLHKIAMQRPKDSSFLFLMPCHSTPLYSHLHVNVSTRFLTCEPNFKGDKYYLNEVDDFYNDPFRWIDREYPNLSNLPSHIISFDDLYFSHPIFDRYKVVKRFFHSNVTPEREGTFILIRELKEYNT